MLVYKAVSQNGTAFWLITINFITDECHDLKNQQLLLLNLSSQIQECNKGKNLIPITGWAIVGFRFNYTVPWFPRGLHFLNDVLMEVRSGIDTAHLENTG